MVPIRYDCRHIWSPTKLQAYLVPTMTDIAGILGPPYTIEFESDPYPNSEITLNLIWNSP